MPLLWLGSKWLTGATREVNTMYVYVHFNATYYAAVGPVRLSLLRPLCLG